MQLQEVVFDYFNLIVKEYFMALDKWTSDIDYTNKIRDSYHKIDKELDEEDLSEPVPEGLTKEMAE
jgi:hypothetical protein